MDEREIAERWGIKLRETVVLVRSDGDWVRAMAVGIDFGEEDRCHCNCPHCCAEPDWSETRPGLRVDMDPDNPAYVGRALQPRQRRRVDADSWRLF